MLAIPSVLDKYQPHVKFFVVVPRKHAAKRWTIDLVVTVDDQMPVWMRRAMRKHLKAILMVTDLWTICEDFGIPCDVNSPPSIYIDIKLAKDGPK